MKKSICFIFLLVVICLLVACGSKHSTESASDEAGTKTRNSTELTFQTTDLKWDDETTLAVEGTVYSFLDGKDIDCLSDLKFDLYDFDNNYIDSVAFDTDADVDIPAQGSGELSFRITGIENGENLYPDGLIPKLVDASYSYHLCDNEDQSSRRDDFGSTCTTCDGTGTIICKVCQGSGINSSYKYLSPVLKAMEKSYCECCNGTGYITCGKCHGSGVE